MTTTPLPPELEQFVEEQVAEGRYGSSQELVVTAVRVLREVETRQRQFSEDVRLGMDQLKRGEFNDYDEAELRQRFEELKRRALSR